MDRKKRIRAVKKNAKRHPMHTHSQSYSDVLAGFLASVAQVQPGGSGPWVDSHRFVLELFIAGNSYAGGSIRMARLVPRSRWH